MYTEDEFNGKVQRVKSLEELFDLLSSADAINICKWSAGYQRTAIRNFKSFINNENKLSETDFVERFIPEKPGLHEKFYALAKSRKSQEKTPITSSVKQPQMITKTSSLETLLEQME
ncbi:MAG TPA: hypothetical protein PLD88_09320, partial [Candidatus Berkiella sp.]|nr:hypothetical protein [Candidatus Berkiella sp.]